MTARMRQLGRRLGGRNVRLELGGHRRWRDGPGLGRHAGILGRVERRCGALAALSYRATGGASSARGEANTMSADGPEPYAWRAGRGSRPLLWPVRTTMQQIAQVLSTSNLLGWVDVIGDIGALFSVRDACRPGAASHVKLILQHFLVILNPIRSGRKANSLIRIGARQKHPSAPLLCFCVYPSPSQGTLHMNRRLILSLAAVLAIGACSDENPTGNTTPGSELASTSGTIGINVILKAPATAANRTELAKYGNADG